MRAPCPTPSRETGFTLIELLVGLFLFGIMAAAGTSLLASAVAASDRAQGLAQDSGDLARAAALLNADCAQAAPRSWRDGEGRVRPAFSADDGALFTLVRHGWANPAGTPRASLQRVRYALEGDRLVRRAATMLDGADAGAATPLLAGVRQARLRLLGSDGWQERWTAQTMPRAAELTLTGPELGEVRMVLLLGPGGAA
ncbi:MAG: type II secretion system minor pseudopilin GspJ [Sandarakinorhabdus sp.]|nr:type II secretion system minor pseudopilin GspJ [Sandarakinorhabdus sp.]